MKKAILLSAICGCSFVANAEMIDFSGIDSGEIVSEQFASLGVHVSTVNTDHPSDQARVYNLNSRHDDGLDGLFETGNIPLDTQLGNILVYQHDDFEFRSEDHSDHHDNHDVQQLIFDFDYGVQSFGFIAMGFGDDLGEHASIEFFRDGASTLLISFDEFRSGGAYDFGAIFGDNSLNQIGEITVAGGFDRAVFNIGDSIGLDNVSFTVPAPGTTLLLSMAAGFGIRRRR